MKVIIAGSREITDPGLLEKVVNLAPFNISQVVSGGARGVDDLGYHWAKSQSLEIRIFPAFWRKFGRGAGPIRNKEMAEYADALILIWDGKSPGSANMLKLANQFRLPYVEFVVLDVDNHDPECRQYKIRMAQNLHNLILEGAGSFVVDELLVYVPTQDASS